MTCWQCCESHNGPLVMSSLSCLVTQWLSYSVAQLLSGSVTQWFSGSVARTLNFPTKRTRVRNPCCWVKPWASLFILHCSSSLSCLNEYLAVDNGGYLCMVTFHALIAAMLDASQRSQDRVQLNRSIRE